MSFVRSLASTMVIILGSHTLECCQTTLSLFKPIEKDLHPFEHAVHDFTILHGKRLVLVCENDIP